MERPFDYPGSSSDIVAPEPHHMVRAENAGSIRHHHGQLGEYCTAIYPYFVPHWWDAEDIRSVVEQRFEAEHCTHSHDCCGHWYAGRGSVVSITDATDDHDERAKLVLVMVRYSQNI